MLTRVLERNLNRHFEMIWESSILLVIYVIGAVFLTRWGDPMLLTAWLTGGVVVGAIVRAFQTNGTADRSENAKKEGQP